MRSIAMIGLILAVVSIPATNTDSQETTPATPSANDEQSDGSAAKVANVSIWLRFIGWGVVGLFGAGGFGAYLRRRPTAWVVVAIWYFAAYHVYASWRTDVSVLPPLFAIALSLFLGPAAKTANDDAVRQGRRREEPHKFTGSGSLTMAFNFITIGLVVSLFAGWSAWDIFPGVRDSTLSHKLVLATMLVTGVPLMMWIDTLAHAGLRALQTVPTMASVFLRCRRGRILLAVVVLCVCIWHSPFAKELPPLRWEMTISLTVSVVLLWLQPPFVLMLGASSAETGAVLGALSHAAFPFRIVALLDPSRIRSHFTPFSWWTDDLRTSSDRDWRGLVDHLIERIPLILLDARTERKAVVYEAEQLLEHPERLQRSTFVVAENGDAPALMLNGVPPSFPGLRVLEPDQVEKVFEFGTASTVTR